MGMRPIAEFQFIDFISAGFDLLDELCREMSLSLGRGIAGRFPWSMRLRCALRSVSLAQRGVVFPEHRGTEDRRAVNRL